MPPFPLEVIKAAKDSATAGGGVVYCWHKERL